MNCSGFTDDLALLTNSIKEIRTQLGSLEELVGKKRLRTSKKKTKIMIRDSLDKLSENKRTP